MCPVLLKWYYFTFSMFFSDLRQVNVYIRHEACKSTLEAGSALLKHQTMKAQGHRRERGSGVGRTPVQMETFSLAWRIFKLLLWEFPQWHGFRWYSSLFSAGQSVSLLEFRVCVCWGLEGLPCLLLLSFGTWGCMTFALSPTFKPITVRHYQSSRVVE